MVCSEFRRHHHDSAVQHQVYDAQKNRRSLKAEEEETNFIYSNNKKNFNIYLFIDKEDSAVWQRFAQKNLNSIKIINLNSDITEIIQI
jgi:hypothetical protein